VAYLVICLFFALGGGIIGKVKGSSYWLWFLISGLVPIGGILAALLYRNEGAVPRRACPGCGKVVAIHDALCTRCGTELDFPDEDEVLEPAGAEATRG
jgi:hypothetical protein